MICTLTARKLKPGEFDNFKAGFEAANEKAPPEILARFKQVFVCRDVSDEDVALTFGLFDGTLDELREIQQAGASERNADLEAMAPLIEGVLLDGAYEVVERQEN